MPGFADYEAYDGLGLADLVRRGKVSPTDLLDAAIARVEARNPVVNGVVTKLYDYARQAIADGLPDGPFRGVPYLLKDLTASLAGVRTMRGSRFFADTPPPAADSEHVKRLKRAGLVVFGRTSTCELGPLPHLRASALRPDSESVGPDPDLRRLERRRSGDRRGAGSFPWPTPQTASGRSARRRLAAGSSGSSRRARGTRWPRTRARVSAASRPSTP